MATDLFEQLGDLEVPPAPEAEQFDRQLHDRVNRSLVAGQLTDMVVGGLPWAAVHFSRALVGLFAVTLTGRYDRKPKNRRR
jgi:hypothetical protein